MTYINEEGRGSTVQANDTALTFSDSLVPRNTYQFNVVAVSIIGNVVARSIQSDPLKFPGKMLVLLLCQGELISCLCRHQCGSQC